VRNSGLLFCKVDFFPPNLSFVVWKREFWREKNYSSKECPKSPSLSVQREFVIEETMQIEWFSQRSFKPGSINIQKITHGKA
jgi:hypothetical protein